MDIILEEGDILYLPRGYWHDPLPLGMETVHLTIAIYPATGLEYIEWLHNKLSYVDEVRQSLSSWQEDKVSIENLADKISNFIKNERSYKEFMNEFVGNQRLETNLNLEILGDVKTSILPDSAKLSLNSNQHYNEDSQFIIANGVKLNLDSDLEPIVVYIAQNPGVLVGDIFKLFNYIDRDKISASLYNLCINDVFEILEY
ncbi:hypothetical protein C0149_08700 [Moraxella catarrhalis]|nr:hypothetical protein [Moraxella catarrhalis]